MIEQSLRRRGALAAVRVIPTTGLDQKGDHRRSGGFREVSCRVPLRSVDRQDMEVAARGSVTEIRKGDDCLGKNLIAQVPELSKFIEGKRRIAPANRPVN